MTDSSIVNALKQNKSVSVAGAGRAKSAVPVRAGVLRGVVSMMSVALCGGWLTIARRVLRTLYILRLISDVGWEALRAQQQGYPHHTYYGVNKEKLKN